MYYVFPNLPQINTNSSPSEVDKRKKNQNVAKCYKSLFKRETADDSATYMTRIIDKVWASKKHIPKIHIAYAISVCEFLLRDRSPLNGLILIIPINTDHLQKWPKLLFVGMTSH